MKQADRSAINAALQAAHDDEIDAIEGINDLLAEVGLIQEEDEIGEYADAHRAFAHGDQSGIVAALDRNRE